MIALLFALTSGSIDTAAQLSKANAKLARVENCPIDSPRDVLPELLEKYVTASGLQFKQEL